MRKQDTKLFGLAKQGDKNALCELGQRYLLGTEGFSRYVDLGLKYLLHPVVINTEQSDNVIAKSLSLAEILKRNLLINLTSAAHAGCASAGFKLGYWRALTQKEEDSARRLLMKASENGSGHARSVLFELPTEQQRSLWKAVSLLNDLPEIDANGTMAYALTIAIARKEFDLSARVLESVSMVPFDPTPELSDAVCHALTEMQRHGIAMPKMGSERLQLILEDCVKRGSPTAALFLGKALCNVEEENTLNSSLIAKRNVRGGAALLFRAADAGLDDAWFYLYQVHGFGRGPVANPQAARFFLEKAAASGNSVAQRQLGIMILKSARYMEEFESGMYLMTQAATQGDSIARSLLCTFVLPAEGDETKAHEAIDQIFLLEPGVAHRLRIARDFGLTKSEAICADFALGVRTWGFIVMRDPVDKRCRSSFSRAIPALNDNFIDHLHEAANDLQRRGENAPPTRSERREREHRIKYALELCGFDESLFFAQATPATLARLGRGASWAHCAKEILSIRAIG